MRTVQDMYNCKNVTVMQKSVLNVERFNSSSNLSAEEIKTRIAGVGEDMNQSGRQWNNRVCVISNWLLGHSFFFP